MIVWICGAVVIACFVGVLAFGAVIVREGRRQRAFIRSIRRG